MYRRTTQGITISYHILAKATIYCPCWRSGASHLNSGHILYLHRYFVYAGSNGCGESTHLHRFAWAFISWHWDKYQKQKCWLIWYILCDTSYNPFSSVWNSQNIYRMKFYIGDHVLIWYNKYQFYINQNFTVGLNPTDRNKSKQNYQWMIEVHSFSFVYNTILTLQVSFCPF